MNWQKVAEEHRKLVDGKAYYAKVKICDLPGERELYFLLWPAGSSSRIHGHPGLGCVQTLLEGEVKEMRYPAKGGWASTNTLLPGTVAYINDDIAYHKVCMHVVMAIDRCSNCISSNTVYFPPPRVWIAPPSFQTLKLSFFSISRWKILVQNGRTLCISTLNFEIPNQTDGHQCCMEGRKEWFIVYQDHGRTG